MNSRGDLNTEKQNSSSLSIDALKISDLLKLINKEDRGITKAINKVIPTYNVVEESGIKHKPKFKISLKINDLYVEGEGVSKQKAEIVAAKKMIKLIKSK